MKKFDELVDSGILFDSHCHLGYLSDVKTAVVMARSSHVEAIVNVAVDVNSAEVALTTSVEYPDFVFATAGLHPEFTLPNNDLSQIPWDDNRVDEELRNLEAFLGNNIGKIMMLGECGLDWYRLPSTLTVESMKKFKALQIKLFEAQVDFAKRFSLPLSIHTRDSFVDTYEIVKNQQGSIKGVFHSFTGSYDQAKLILDQGFLIGVNGIVTYKSAEELRETVKSVMGKRTNSTVSDFYKKGIIFETDTPYLRPSNSTIKSDTNVPANVSLIYDFVRNLIDR
jgi:TatD DNase family protein